MVSIAWLTQLPSTRGLTLSAQIFEDVPRAATVLRAQFPTYEATIFEIIDFLYSGYTQCLRRKIRILRDNGYST